MEIKESKFVTSNTDQRMCPPPVLPEFAFIGRSNVGKSSLINMLTQRKNLARISVQPGKTQLINHFLIDDRWYLVDLPGYGYAKVSKKSRAQWQRMIDGYLTHRINLMCTFILVDLRIEPQANDQEMIDKFGANQWPFALVFTKADKLKPAEVTANYELYRQSLLERWEELPPMFITSAEKATGRDEVLAFIDESRQFFDAEAIARTLGNR
ncbi:MAG: ribosome biogenesis GTP-binding protein YihA/YsxC [Bacteroidales bacterium]|jgi:GTP-binding protein|nr:ribosome biogenesis GTP-binding protein YihA/YsxC [Bacteroidales bacterium]NCU36432.1 YihA family ribosome biogenesis GTP-binding protein [Candidatus Falkowbacteria bacterium]MDD2632249.1 ribosome biogenesis GTP-binding protein YihA/YsxC [Bacteroidales bacterium]MDD3527930.1 ribosome biogenesis GTP-binding protein YihA/YsxC [Bacteroidales bacterium]MDD4176879.1 ribosome biogenesis GTP-binding protein YihA/YsxC [Bacteroidales bacterium]